MYGTAGGVDGQHGGPMTLIYDTETGPGGSDPPIVERRVVDVKQTVVNNRKMDLGPYLDALLLVPVVSELVEYVTGSQPNVKEVTGLAELAGGQAEQVAAGSGNVWQVTVPLTGKNVAWPSELGGPSRPGEEKRWVVITVRHAAWRDRRTRRLARVVVKVRECPFAQHRA